MTATEFSATDRADTALGTLVLARGVSFADVADAFAGWDGGPTDLTPDLAGEPISARWSRAGVDVSYSANPVLGLRVLTGTGLAQVRSLLPAMSAAQAAELAGSTDTAEALLGVTARGLLADVSALPALERLAGRAGRSQPAGGAGSLPPPEPRAERAAQGDARGGAAALATRRIGLAALAAGSATLTHRAKRHPDRDPVLGLLEPPSVRRQVLRLFLTEPPEDRARVLAVVRAGLADPDWEVQWSALLGAHDLGLAEVIPELRRCRLPADRALRPALEAVRDVAGHRLAGGRSTVFGLERIEAVLDGVTSHLDATTLLVTSLREPVPDPAEPEAGDPPGFPRIPVVAHWLGNDATAVRRATPGASFAVAAAPCADVSMVDVMQTLRVLGSDCRRPLRLPTPDELEMAVRGPDGRRFPWGNAREPGWRSSSSPWGLAAPLRTAEWVDAGDAGLLALPPARQGCGFAPVAVGAAAVRPVLASG